MGIESIYTTEGFHDFFKYSPLSLVVKASAPDFLVMAVSDDYLHLFHQQRQDLLGKSLFEVLPVGLGNDLDKYTIYGSFCRVIATRKRDVAPLFRYEVFVSEIGDKQVFYCSFVNDPVLNAEGEVEYLINTTTNITEEINQEEQYANVVQQVEALQKVQILNMELAATNEELIRVQEEMSLLNLELEERVAQRTNSLSESEARFRNMAENAAVLITMSDEHNRSVYFNKAWESLTGIPVERLLQMNRVEILHPLDQARFLDTIGEATKNLRPWKMEFRVLDKNGQYYWLMANGAVRFNTDGSFAGFISSCIDITEQKQDDMRKDDFIGMVSHELKTPLTSIKGYIQILQSTSQKRNYALTENLLDKTNLQIAKMIRMVNGFLNVSRLESGKIYIDYEHFDLAGLLREAKEETTTIINSHQVIFSAIEETWVNADRDKVGQVINNLISNAVKYSPIGSPIEVGCITRRGDALISVKDEGMGIEKEDMPKLFDRYYRVKSQVNNIGGFGIGLYLCCEIIKCLGGKIWVESEIGKGSTFYFTIPVA